MKTLIRLKLKICYNSFEIHDISIFHVDTNIGNFYNNFERDPATDVKRSQ